MFFLFWCMEFHPLVHGFPSIKTAKSSFVLKLAEVISLRQANIKGSMVHQIHKLLEQLKLIPGQNMEVQKLLFSFIGWNFMHLVWFPCISCMEFRPPWSDFHTLAWKSDSSIPAWCGSDPLGKKQNLWFSNRENLAVDYTFYFPKNPLLIIYAWHKQMSHLLKQSWEDVRLVGGFTFTHVFCG